MLASTDKRVTSRLKKISVRPALIFHGTDHPQIVSSRLKKISPRLTYIFFTYIYQQSIQANHYQIDLKKIYTSYVFLLKAKTELTNSLAIKKLVVVGGIFS
jgi:hypothetical protein